VGTFKRKPGLLHDYYIKILKEVGYEWDERIHTKNKSVYGETSTKIQAEWNVEICNDIADFNHSDIDYDYYVKETKKIVSELK
jgi:hypothetical protein